MDLKQFSIDLETDDLLTRVRAASGLGASGELPALPILKSHIKNSDDPQREDVCVAVRSIGHILGQHLRDLERQFASGEHLSACETPSPMDELSCSSSSPVAQYYRYLIAQATTSTGQYLSSVLFALCLAGPSLSDSRSKEIVAEAILQNDVEKMRYRGYQYACAVDPTLLATNPWRSFIPGSEQLRHEWNIHRVLTRYF